MYAEEVLNYNLEEIKLFFFIKQNLWHFVWK